MPESSVESCGGVAGVKLPPGRTITSGAVAICPPIGKSRIWGQMVAGVFDWGEDFGTI